MFLRDMLARLALIQPSVSLVWVPLAAAVTLAAIIIFLLFRLRANMRLAARGLVTRVEFDAEIQRLRAELQRVEARLIESAATPIHTAPVWMNEPVAVNLNRRGQILRMRRKGGTVQEIAAALHISPGEVELTVKVDGLAANAGSMSISSAPL